MPSHTDPLFDRAAGCLMGQIAGDSLGGLVEFCSPATIRERYPDGPRLLEDGGTWNILAGQPTDDSEMALMLARLLPEAVEYDAEEARRRYLFWLESGPFNMGRTIALGLASRPGQPGQRRSHAREPAGHLRRHPPLARRGPLGATGCGPDPCPPGLPAGQCPVCLPHRAGHPQRRFSPGPVRLAAQACPAAAA